MIRQGDVTKVQSISEFDTQFVDDRRVYFESLADDEQRAIIEEFNELEEPEEPAETIEDLPEFVFEEYHEWLDVAEIPPYQVIINVLDADNREYVHLFDGTVHTIVELYPEEW